tara:strand:+ start:1811 stop:2566 length:756 start_codon:yes stop_codon:yes gene_type:complete
MSLNMDLTGKVAIVTGASRGIGRAIAEKMMLSGAHVIGTATSARGVDTIETYMKEGQGRGIGLELDISSQESIDTFFEQVQQKFDRVDILVNNAGITRDNLMLRMKDDEWSDIIDTNLTSLFRLSKKVLRPMMKNKYGRIINIGSVVGSKGNPGQANYCAAKAGLLGFTKSLAQEVASRHITVNAIAPGFIQTEMTAQLSETQQEQIAQQIPMNRMGLASEIADAVLFMSSSSASYITGETLHVNGGMYMS